MSKISPPFSKGNEFSDGPDLQLLHHPVAMRLDRALAPAQRASDLHTSEHRNSANTSLSNTPSAWLKRASSLQSVVLEIRITMLSPKPSTASTKPR